MLAKLPQSLHYACLHDHHQVVENLIQAGVNITLVDNEGNQPLHIASSYSSVKIVKTLLKHMGDEWFQQNSNNMSALEIAVDLGRADVVCVLISHMHRHLDHHPLCVILSCYSEGLFQKLLQMVSFDTYFCKAHGIPVLIVALINEPHTEENVDTVHNWFSFDFDLRLKLALRGGSRKQLASIFRHIDGILEDTLGLWIKDLIEFKNYENQYGNTLLHYSCWYHAPRMAKCLLEIKADHTLNQDGNTPLHLSCLHGDAELTKLILDNKVYKNMQNGDNLCPLSVACTNGKLQIVESWISSKLCI